LVLGAETKMIGTITITKVDEKYSVGTLDSAGADLKKGDLVEFLK